MSPLRVTVKVKGVLPELPSALLASVAAMASVGSGSASSLVIVPVAEAVLIVPPTGLESVTVKASFGSTVVSPLTLMVITFEVSPALKVTVPLGSAPPAKSAALAGLAPLPRDRIVDASSRRWCRRVRVTVKVKGVLAGVALRLGGVGGRNGQRGRRQRRRW